MSWRFVTLRFLALAALAVWLGGFTFYSAVVVPELHARIEGRVAGTVTQHATDSLNVIGVGCVAIWWLLVRFDQPSGRRWCARSRLITLTATTVLLLVLLVLHRLMDHRLATTGLSGFYPYHRAYLIVSTAQWFLNLGLFLTVAAHD